MTDFAISSLADITDTGTLSGVISGTEHTAFRDDVESRVANLNDAAAALESNFSSASAPTDNTVQGKIWYDTGNSFWKGDPDGAGADDKFLTELSAKNIDVATGGTATHKIPGVIKSDITAVAKAGSTGTLITYTIPANTLDANGKILRFTCWGSKTGANSTAKIEVRFASAAVEDFLVQSLAGAWWVQVLYIRTGSSAQDVSIVQQSSQPTGANPGNAATAGYYHTQFATDAEDTTATIAFDLNVSTIDASDTITQEGLLVELLN